MSTPDMVEHRARGRKALLRSGFLRRWQTRVQSSSNYKWLVIVVVCMTAFMSTVEQGMLNVALPMMTTELRTDLSTIQWVVTSQLLVITALLLPTGRLGDFLGRERVFCAGIVLITLGSALCGMAQSVEQLIFFRVLQGVGGAMILGNHQALMVGAFPANELGRAVGATSTTVGIGYLAGPGLGGFIVDMFGWRTSFFLRVPVGILGLAMALLILRSTARSKGGFRFDVWGALALAVSTVALLLAINQGEARGWLSPLIVALLTIFSVSLLVFLGLEKRSKDPLIDLGVFRFRLFSSASICNFLNFFSLFAVAVLVPFYLVQVAGFQASQAGLILTAQPLMMAIAAPVAGWTCDRVDSRYLTTGGIVLSCLGLFLLSGVDTQTPPQLVAVELGFIGLGTGLFMAPNVRDVLSSLPPDKLGISSAFVPLTRNLGSSLSVGVFSAIFASRVVAYGGAEQVAGALADPAVMVMAFRDTFIGAGILYALSIPISLVRGDRRMGKGSKMEERHGGHGVSE